jgi:transcriptional regulator with XRE-family HTH domain
MKVRELRVRRGWTQLELSRHSGVHAADISKIESGRLVPFRTQLRRLARALRVKPEDLAQQPGEGNSQ